MNSIVPKPAQQRAPSKESPWAEMLAGKDTPVQVEFIRGDSRAEAMAKANAENKAEELADPWLMNFEGVKGARKCIPYYDINHDAFGYLDQGAVRALLEEWRFAVLATVWGSQGTPSKPGQDLILAAVREIAVRAVLQKDTDAARNDPQVVDVIEKFDVGSIVSSSTWMLVRTPSPFFQNLLESQKVAYHKHHRK